jgi:hypothetical protein
MTPFARFALTFALLGTPVIPAFAADPAAATLGSFQVTADLRDEYLQGQPLLVHLDVANIGKESRNFPDLVNRPWLVQFDIDRGGKLETRFTTPPVPDPDKTWRLAPGVQRDVLLEIPSAGGLPVGTYVLTVRIAGPEGEISIGPRPYSLVAPKPIGADSPFQPGTANKVGQMTVWAHKGKQDGLYLHVADVNDLRRPSASYALGNASTDSPRLSMALPTQAWSRHVFWQEGDRGLALVPLLGPGKAGEIFHLNLPWPKVEILGGGITAPDGTFHLPIWVPGPKGVSGDVQVLDVKEGHTPTFRAVAPFTVRPDGITSTVDVSGNLRFLVRQGSTVDLYFADSTAGNVLPAKGLRIPTPPQHTPLFARFAEHTTAEKGGLSVFVVDRVAGAEPTITARWHALSGENAGDLGPFPLPADLTVLDAVPVGAKGLALLLADGTGKRFFWVDGGKPTPVPGVAVSLIQDKQGATWVETLGGAPVSYVAVAPAPKP